MKWLITEKTYGDITSMHIVSGLDIDEIKRKIAGMVDEYTDISMQGAGEDYDATTDPDEIITSEDGTMFKGGVTDLEKGGRLQPADVFAKYCVSAISVKALKNSVITDFYSPERTYCGILKRG